MKKLEKIFKTERASTLRTVLEKWEADTEKLNKMLEAAVGHCIYRINGLCYSRCPARDYCEPETCNLKTTEDIGGKD